MPFSLVADTLWLPADLGVQRDPVKGWQSLYDCVEFPDEHRRMDPHFPVPREIVEDCRKFIDERKFSTVFVGQFRFYENGAGQHAVKLVVEDGHDEYRTFFLMYDNSNVRKKVVKGPSWHHTHF